MAFHAPRLLVLPRVVRKGKKKEKQPYRGEKGKASTSCSGAALQFLLTPRQSQALQTQPFVPERPFWSCLQHCSLRLCQQQGFPCEKAS